MAEIVPDGMTPKALRDVAWALDQLSRLTKVLYEPIATGKAAGAGTVTVTCELTQNGEPASPEVAQYLVDFVASEEMQEDLRRWAEAIRPAPRTPCICPKDEVGPWDPDWDGTISTNPDCFWHGEATDG